MRFLSNKEKKEIQEKLPLGYTINKKDDLKEKEGILYKGEDKFLIIQKGQYYPHLLSIDENLYKSVYIDKGAISFILKGADLMRPGIVRIDDGINEGDTILIKDEGYGKNLAIGTSLLTSENMQVQEKGKSVKIYHYFKDQFW